MASRNLNQRLDTKHLLLILTISILVLINHNNLKVACRIIKEKMKNNQQDGAQKMINLARYSDIIILYTPAYFQSPYYHLYKSKSTNFAACIRNLIDQLIKSTACKKIIIVCCTKTYFFFFHNVSHSFLSIDTAAYSWFSDKCPWF